MIILAGFAVVGLIAWGILKDVPGGRVQKFTANGFRSQPADDGAERPMGYA